MNFLNFLTSGAGLFNFNLLSVDKKQNSTLSGNQPQKQSQIALKNSELPSQGQSLPSASQETPIKQLLAAQEQFLINQYLQMNYMAKQIIANKSPTLDSIHQPQKKEKQAQKEEKQQIQPIKKTKRINKCGHDEKAHYAKGMCNNCYHKFGRTKKPWNCGHSKLYAGGMCQNCYINNYNRKKRQQKNAGSESIQVQEVEHQKKEILE